MFSNILDIPRKWSKKMSKNLEICSKRHDEINRLKKTRIENKGMRNSRHMVPTWCLWSAFGALNASKTR